MSARSAAPRKYPVGIPVQPPPGWRPPVPLVPIPPPLAPAFRAQFALILRAMLLSLLMIVCMGIGWFLVAGRRPREAAQAAVIAPPTQAKDDRPEPPKAMKEDPPAPRKEDPPRPKDPPRRELTYAKDVLPIIEQACVSCHGQRKKGSLDLRTYDALLKGGDSGAGVVPGKPDDSPLYDTIKTNRMPPGQKKLSAGDRELVRAWIAAGAKAK